LGLQYNFSIDLFDSLTEEVKLQYLICFRSRAESSIDEDESSLSGDLLSGNAETASCSSPAGNSNGEKKFDSLLLIIFFCTFCLNHVFICGRTNFKTC